MGEEVSRKSAFESMQAKGWTPADAGCHPLVILQGKRLDAYSLAVLLGTKNKVGAGYFQVFLRDAPGEVE
ncbi:MAG: hypothetical protein HY530_06795 [Chloroflexi bacterium]|nr:hypothetical protein [Chloroflexota bacterium]